MFSARNDMDVNEYEKYFGRGRDRMVTGFTTISAISAYRH
jgi:hypothetical protein